MKNEWQLEFLTPSEKTAIRLALMQFLSPKRVEEVVAEAEAGAKQRIADILSQSLANPVTFTGEAQSVGVGDGEIFYHKGWPYKKADRMISPEENDRIDALLSGITDPPREEEVPPTEGDLQILKFIREYTNLGVPEPSPDELTNHNDLPPVDPDLRLIYNSNFKDFKINNDEP